MLETVFDFRKITWEQHGGVTNLLSPRSKLCSVLPLWRWSSMWIEHTSPLCRLTWSGSANRGCWRATARRYPSSPTSSSSCCGGRTSWGHRVVHRSSEVGIRWSSFHALLFSPRGRICFLPWLLPCALVVFTASSYHLLMKLPSQRIRVASVWVLAKVCPITRPSTASLAVTPITLL